MSTQSAIGLLLFISLLPTQGSAGSQNAAAAPDRPTPSGLQASRVSAADVQEQKRLQTYSNGESIRIAGAAACLSGDSECLELTAVHARLRDQARKLTGVAELTSAAKWLPPDVQTWWSEQVLHAAVGALQSGSAAEKLVQSSDLVREATSRAQHNLVGTILFASACRNETISAAAQQFALLAEQALHQPGALKDLASMLPTLDASAKSPPGWAQAGVLAFAVPKSLVAACGMDHSVMTPLGAVSFALAFPEPRMPASAPATDGRNTYPVQLPVEEPDLTERTPGELPTTLASPEITGVFLVARIRPLRPGLP